MLQRGAVTFGTESYLQQRVLDRHKECCNPHILAPQTYIGKNTPSMGL